MALNDYTDATGEERIAALNRISGRDYLIDRNTELENRDQYITNVMEEELRAQMVTGQGYEGALQNQPIQNLIDRLEDPETLVRLRMLEDLKEYSPTTYARMIGGNDDTTILYKAYRNAEKKYLAISDLYVNSAPSLIG